MDDPASDSTSDSTASSPDEQVIEGRSASPGIAIGTVYRYQAPSLEPQRGALGSEDEVEDELARFDDALRQAQEELEQVRSVAQDRLGSDGEAIFDAQKLMLDDEELLGAVRRRIRDDHESTAHALSAVLRRHRQRLETSDDPYLRDRASDLNELEARLLSALERDSFPPTIEPGSIVVADWLSAADLIRFSRNGMLGCVTTQGGPTSHVSILARALHLPAVVGAEGATAAVASRDRAIVDGRRGQLIVRPRAETLERYQGRRTQPSLAGGADRGRVDEPAETRDGCRITLRANVDFRETLDTFDEYGAEGIGLLRTEMFPPSGGGGVASEDEQESLYRRAAMAAGEHEATIRLLDLGGDKRSPGAEREDNPFLGWRGIRVLLDRPGELLRPQVRALLRANAHGTLRVLLPMVAHLDELHRVRAVVDEEAERLAAADTAHDPNLPLGVMVEVPAVALQAEAFAEAADFLSIGTNDLTQYVLAVDRGNEHVAGRFDALHPAVLRLVRRTVAAGQATDTPVSLCGEVAGDTCAVPILLGLGLTTLSVAPPFLPRLKRLVRAIEHGATQDLAAAACAAPDSATVRRQAREWLDQQEARPDEFEVRPERS